MITAKLKVKGLKVTPFIYRQLHKHDQHRFTIRSGVTSNNARSRSVSSLCSVVFGDCRQFRRRRSRDYSRRNWVASVDRALQTHLCPSRSQLHYGLHMEFLLVGVTLSPTKYLSQYPFFLDCVTLVLLVRGVELTIVLLLGD